MTDMDWPMPAAVLGMTRMMRGRAGGLLLGSVVPRRKMSSICCSVTPAQMLMRGFSDNACWSSRGCRMVETMYGLQPRMTTFAARQPARLSFS